MQYITTILLTVFVVGCASIDSSSEKALSEEINAIVNNEMPLTDAIAALEIADFSCQEGTALDPRKKGIFECTRNKGGFLYGCIHRVWFEGTSKNGAISNLEIHRPACASL